MGGDMMASINTLPSIDQSPNVTMGLFAGTAGNFQLTFDNINSFDPTSYIYLEDKKTNTMQDMRSNNTYNFTSALSDSTDRFVVHFTPAVEITTADATCNTSGNININQPGTANWTDTVTDNNNATISSGTLNQNSPVTVNAASGTYTLTLTDANNYTVMKTVTVNGTTAVTAAFASANTTTTNVDVAFNSSTADASSYYWDFGDGSTGSGQNAIHNYADTGTYTVTLIVVSASGCSSTASHTITVTANATTGINNISNGKPINIWSSDNRVFIDFSKQTKVEATIEFYNVLGQELMQEKFGRSTIFIKELSNIEAAYVIVKVKNDDVITTKKVFVANK
jgi:PKD repeat protein